MKQISWLSFFSALPKPCRAAMARISSLDSPPRGNRLRDSCSWVRLYNHVALVLLRVEGLFQQTAAGGAVPLHAHIVAGGHRLRPQLQGPAEQLPNLIPRLQSTQGLGVQPAS